MAELVEDVVLPMQRLQVWGVVGGSEFAAIGGEGRHIVLIDRPFLHRDGDARGALRWLFGRIPGRRYLKDQFFCWSGQRLCGRHECS